MKEFEELYKSTFESLYRFFYYKSVGKSDVEDLVQEVFSRFYGKYFDKRLSKEESTKILYGISKNLYKEWVRKSIKENRVDFIDNIQFDEIVDEDEEDLMSENRYKIIDEQKLVVHKAMEKLSANVKLVLEYRFIHNMTRKQIAEKMGMKQKDVHTYQKRGIKYLKKIIGNDNVPLKS